MGIDAIDVQPGYITTIEDGKRTQHQTPMIAGANMGYAQAGRAHANMCFALSEAKWVNIPQLIGMTGLLKAVAGQCYVSACFAITE